MAGYCRQSAGDIVANAVIKAAPVNAEFNCVRDAFNATSGHKHDGTSTEGAYVPLISDTNAYSKVCVDTSNSKIRFYTNVASAAEEQVIIQNGVVVPATNADVDLGASGTAFKDLYIGGISATGNVDVGGTFDVTGNSTLCGTLGVTGVATFSDTVCAPGVTATGTATLATVDINAGTIDNTVIGATTPVAGSFTTLSTTGQGTFASVDINGGTIDGAVIGGTTAAAITGTTITGTSFVGPVTGNVTGNLTGDVTGDLTGDVTGNVTASTGSSTFNNVTINGTLDVTSTVISNVSDPVADSDASNKGYVDTQITNLIGGAPGALDTLNELAAALNDDANAYTTLTTCLGTKLATAGGTMTGAIAMGTNKITGLGDPTAAQDAATQNYVTTNFLGLSGGTMTGAIDMGSSKITTTYTPTDNADLTTKTYVDSILGSATSAASSATAAATSATNASTSETNASNSASAAASSATSAANSFDAFDDRYLGSKTSDPSVDNDGDALLTGAIYWNSTANQLKLYNGSAWVSAAFTLGDALTEVSQDTTPVLGGNLDAGTYSITNATNVCATNLYGSLTGNVTGCVSTLSNFASSDVSFGSVCVTANPTTACQLATKEYVDTIAAAGIHYHTAVRVEAPSNLTATYDNGTAGVGATLTNSGTQAAITIDGIALSLNDRVLIYNQTNAAHNGIYTVTTVGDGATNWVLTRATDADSYGASDSDALGEGDAFFVLEGDTGAGELYVMNTSGTITFGTTNITFSVIAETAVYSAGTNLTLSGTEFSVVASPTFTTVDFGNWTITESGGSLYFATGGTNKMKLDASGNLDVVGNVNTNATIS
jgi:hypothetical protein